MSTSNASAVAEEKEAVILEILQIQNRLTELYRQIRRAAQANAALTEETVILERYLASLSAVAVEAGHDATAPVR